MIIIIMNVIVVVYTYSGGFVEIDDGWTIEEGNGYIQSSLHSPAILLDQLVSYFIQIHFPQQQGNLNRGINVLHENMNDKYRFLYQYLF